MHYKRISRTYVEQTTDEEIVAGAGRAHRRVNERTHAYEELWVNKDWESSNLKDKRLSVSRSANHPHLRQPFDGNS